VQISKISGKLASPATPAEFVVSTLKYAWAPSPATDDGAVSLEYDAACNGQVSPFTPAEDVKKWYLIVPTSFMPGGMDLKEITQRWKQSTAIAGVSSWVAMSGNVTYNFNNIFVESPTTACGDRAVKPDTNIQVQLSTPTEWATISTNFSVSYTIAAPKNIRKVLVLLDDQTVWTFMYTQWVTKNITDTKSVSLMATWFKNGNYTLQLVAFDFAGFSNSKSISVKLDKWSTPPPAPNTGTGN
jgi:hypothetical protein